MRRATAQASSTLVAVPLAGEGMPRSSSSLPNSLRSSARSILAGSVPMMGTPRRLSGSARVSGVCPPNCTITPSGFSVSQMLSTSSSVSGSKYSRSLVS